MDSVKIIINKSPHKSLDQYLDADLNAIIAIQYSCHQLSLVIKVRLIVCFVLIIIVLMNFFFETYLLTSREEENKTQYNAEIISNFLLIFIFFIIRIVKILLWYLFRRIHLNLMLHLGSPGPNVISNAVLAPVSLSS